MKLKSFMLDIKNIISLKKYAPRNLILIIDLLISFFSFSLSYLIILNFELHRINADAFLKALWIVLIIRDLFFLITKSYSGIIRYTSTKDATRISSVIASTNILLLIINYINYTFVNPGQAIIPNSIIIIDFFTTSFTMISYRLIVKTLFNELSKDITGLKKCIIVGIGENALTLQHFLYNNKNINYKIECFLDPNNKNEKKSLENIPIYKIDSFLKNPNKYEIDELYFSHDKIDQNRKKEIIEICLENKIKTYTIPNKTNWLKDTFNASQIRGINIEDLLERPAIKLDDHAIGNYLQNKRILVTGAAGSIGSETVMQIIPYNPEMIIVLDQAESPLYDLELQLRETNNFYNFKIVIGDITDPIRIRRVFDAFKPHAVFHAAAYKHVPMMENNPYEAVKSNVFGSKNIADLAIEYKVDKFVMVSTDKAVNPTNVMGASKRIAEIYTQALNSVSDTKFITTRFGNVLGSNGSVIQRFKKQIQAGEYVTVTHPEVSRFFMTIPEACQLILQAGALGKGGEIFIFDMGKSVKIIDLAKKMIKLYGLRLGSDINLKFIGLRPGEKLIEELLNVKENTLPTSHEKIMVAKVRDYPMEKIKADLKELKTILETHNNFSIVGKMKEIVPEFISKNSIYENLENKIGSSIKPIKTCNSNK